jgi:hypothetical protein
MHGLPYVHAEFDFLLGVPSKIESFEKRFNGNVSKSTRSTCTWDG